MQQSIRKIKFAICEKKFLTIQFRCGNIDTQQLQTLCLLVVPPKLEYVNTCGTS